MTADPLAAPTFPIAGQNVAEIHRRLRDGQTVDAITLVGRHRGSWTRADVLRVGWAMFNRPADREIPHDPPAPRPTPVVRELRPCGTTAAYSRHKRRKEPPCEPCRLAHNEARTANKRRAKRRQRKRAGITLPPRLAAVCEHVLAGRTDEEIARRMDVTAKTAARYRARVACALGVPATDIAWAMETGRVCVEGVAA